MKLLLTAAVVTMIVLGQGPTNYEAPSDIIVVKFTWSTYQPPSEAKELNPTTEGSSQTTAATYPRPRPRSTPRTQGEEEIMREQDVQNRSRDLREMERQARTSPKSRDSYIYQLQIRNAGKQLVRSLIWEYQSSLLPGNSVPRQFFCRAKIKPNETKSFYVISPSPPARVIAATDIEEDQPKEKRVIVNRIEYDHGLVWQRTSWETEVLSKLGSLKVSGGRCASL